MQTEIENVIRAYKQEVGKEEKLLLAFLTALAVSSAARKKMTVEMAQAVAENQSSTSATQPATNNLVHQPRS